MTTARFNFVARKVAPHREAISVDWRPDGQTVKLVCGHEIECVPHCHIKVGSRHVCQQCGEKIAKDFPEFAGQP